METSRNRIAIHGSDPVLSNSLRLLLDTDRVDVISPQADDLSEYDILVWLVDGTLPERELATISRQLPTLVVADSVEVIDAVEAGCRGFLPSSASLEEIREATVQILEGGAVVHPDLLGTLLRHLVDRGRRDREKSTALDGLTPRERQVFRLAAGGASREEIGEVLFISPATARTHLQSVYRKLGIHSQAQLMAFAMRTDESRSEEGDR